MSAKPTSHWETDEFGQVWWVTRHGRTRGVIKRCTQCSNPFNSLPTKRRLFCSNRCSGESRLQTPQIVVTRIGERGEIRWGQSDNGDWWELRGAKAWTRAKESACTVCGGMFIQRQGRNRKTCGRTCGGRSRTDYKTGSESPSWRGGIWIGKGGYRYLYKPDHPNAVGPGKKYVAEHRLVMENEIGRLLEPHERVHHLDGDKLNNKPENLELWVGGHPTGQRKGEGQTHCATCTCFEVGS